MYSPWPSCCSFNFADSTKNLHCSRSFLSYRQRRAARFVKSDYRRTASVSKLLDDLGWSTLSDRRKESRLSMFGKAVAGRVSVTHGQQASVTKPLGWVGRPCFWRARESNQLIVGVWPRQTYLLYLLLDRLYVPSIRPLGKYCCYYNLFAVFLSITGSV